MMAKIAFVLLITLMLAIEVFPKHLPPVMRKSIVNTIDHEYSDVIFQHRTQNIKAILDKMEKDSALVGRPRFGRSYPTKRLQNPI